VMPIEYTIPALARALSEHFARLGARQGRVESRITRRSE